ncbi:MAG TPA: hypothetical protein VFS49_00570 [Croceibacterium sp.]|nr:hypothetical protein [Croceibacterium sp.]
MKAPRPLIALLVLAPAPLAAQAPAAQAPAATPAPGPARASLAAQMLAGSWALRIDGTVLFRFDLETDGAGWRGRWVKPTSFVTDGALFGSLAGPPVEQRSMGGRALGEWAELTFGDTRPGAVPDVFRFRLVSPDRAEMIYADTGFAPFTLERIDAATAAGPWPAGKVYRRAGVQPGALVTYNAGPRTPPRAEPTPAPNSPVEGPPAPTDRPPAVIGR